MSLKTAIVSRLTRSFLGEARLRKLRSKAEMRRRKEGRPHVVEFFHQPDDPHSRLLAQALPAFAERYDVELKIWLVGPPPDWAAPERERLVAWCRVDAARLAARAGLDPEAEDPAVRQLIAGARTGGDARREQLGHYLGATLYYEGEWYWGLDRLHYLETRLADLGARRAGAPGEPLFVPPSVPSSASASAAAGRTPDIHWFLSFRSPYTYIAAERVKALADASGTRLQLRYVLPMRMRGLPVPKMKSRYIVTDVAREARRLGVPFGRIADPLGEPVERGYSLLAWAIGEGRGYEYCLAFMRGVWSQGIDAGSDRGLARIVSAAGLDWEAARQHLGSDHWRAVAEANREELLGLGLWGVPSFRVGDAAIWGQDRLWAVEDEVLRQSGAGTAGD
ncbi:DsbA family protein [Lentisalinibacter sediminis]|uniref:DsbA family protein n=1 Tax=Lentisalinibacter sediminis TaxID=2992237 RepID=UPI00386F5F59